MDRVQYTALMRKTLLIVGSVLIVLTAITFTLPTLFAYQIAAEQKAQSTTSFTQFPVTVDPQNKTITESVEVNAYFTRAQSPFTAAVAGSGDIAHRLFAWIAIAIAKSPWYERLASPTGGFVVITPGMRKEQVANAFGSALSWTAADTKTFLTRTSYATLPLAEGSFAPGVYSVSSETTPLMAQSLVNDRFSTGVLAHYGTTTAQIVPLSTALTVASLIEREAGGQSDMRIISGIIWHRLFINMPLQIDATLQYAKVNALKTSSWWPAVTPRDLKRASPYNTYLHTGLPPTPIANPSVASVLAALNPINTSCLFYFHDAQHHFHCSNTYAEHVALLKQYFGHGK